MNVNQIFMIPLCVSLGLTYTLPTSATEGLGSTEIKNLRHISRSILTARLQDKKQIESLVDTVKKNLTQVENELAELEKQAMKSPVSITKKSQLTNVAFDGTTSQQAKTVTQTNGFKKAQKERMTKVLNGIKSKRTALESNFIKFWKISSNNKYKKMGHDKLKYVENNLASMMAEGKYDIQKITKLKESIKVKARQQSKNKIEPTLQSRTKHRN